MQAILKLVEVTLSFRNNSKLKSSLSAIPEQADNVLRCIACFCCFVPVQVTFTHHPQGNLRKKSPSLTTKSGFDLLYKLLMYDPKKRISAKEALDHQYFKVTHYLQDYCMNVFPPGHAPPSSSRDVPNVANQGRDSKEQEEEREEPHSPRGGCVCAQGC